MTQLQNYYNNLIQHKMNSELIPHWEYNGKKYASKTVCFEHAGEDWRKVHFNLYDSVFVKQDWTDRPSTDIQSLYDHRICQLREKYDYVRVLYSGGTDSTAILEAAMRNDIHIDELVICYAADGDYINRAETDRAVQILEQFKPKLKYTKFTHIAYDKQDITEYWKYQNQLSGHLYYPSTPQSLEYHYLYTSKSDIMKALWSPVDRGLSHCDVFGKEPSSITEYNGEPVWFLTDNKVVYHTTAWSEWFYTTPDLPEFQNLQNHLSLDIMTKYGVRTCDPLSFDEQGWKDVCKITKRYYHPDARNDKMRSGTRKDLMRVYEYVKTDPLFQSQFLEYYQENAKNPLYMVNWPKIALWELQSNSYGLHTNKTYNSAKLEWFKSRSKKTSIPEEQSILDYFKTLWQTLNIPNRKEP